MNKTQPLPTDALAPCPFCGAAATGYAIEAHEHSGPLQALVPDLPDHPGSYVIEGDCACGSGLIGATQAEVTERWNRRTPAPVGVEPVAWRVRRLDSPNYWIIFLHKPVDALMDLKREVQPLYTTPQPTQAQAGAVPLNHKNIEPVRRFLADRGIYLSDETTKALITVSQGIKGGQRD